MGCKQSKGELLPDNPEQDFVEEERDDTKNLIPEKEKAKPSPSPKTRTNGGPKTKPTIEAGDSLYELLINSNYHHDKTIFWPEVVQICKSDSTLACYIDPGTDSTPLHEACKLVDFDDGTGFIDTKTTATQLHAVRALIKADPNALSARDEYGKIPLHYAVAPLKEDEGEELPLNRWKKRGAVLKLLIASDYETSLEYLSRNDVVFDEESGGRTPLYHAIESIPDDFSSPGPTVDYIAALQEANPKMVGVGNASDGDKPLALLYRRFTRQFDLSEKFFAGDNSRREVVEHRREYKCAAGNTWKIIELLLRPENAQSTWRIVHSAVRVDTPPDLLRYIVETNAEDLTKPDEEGGNLPLHYAALSKPSDEVAKSASFPAFYSKYVVDELLYKFPEGASITNRDGKYPLTLAIESGKHFIGGGVKSLYDAYPDALKQTNLDEHPVLKKALVDETQSETGSDLTPEGGVVKDEQFDAIMLVQKEDAAVIEVVTSMWAYEEDAGVQMLGCMAVTRNALLSDDENEVLGIALSAVAAAVNAMKAHPNEAAVQDKACTTLKTLASADGKREVSFVALGAVAAIVGAMQAHVGDPVVQEEACGAIAAIVREGGADRATIVGSVSGLTAIVNAIAAHPDIEGVQQEGCRALRMITDYPSANLPDLPRSQIEPLLQAAKSNFPDKCGGCVNVVLSRLK